MNVGNLSQHTFWGRTISRFPRLSLVTPIKNYELSVQNKKMSLLAFTHIGKVLKN